MKLCISIIHLGRYRLDILDDDNQIISGTDGGLALVLMWVTKYLAEPEHSQYITDQRRSSDELGAEAIGRAFREATPAERTFLEDLNRKREAAKANRAIKLIKEIKDPTNR